MKRIIEEKIEKEKILKKKIVELNERIKEKIESQELLDLLNQKDRLFFELIDIVNEKWDLLSNNHFTLHFKSLSRKIDELKAFYEEIRVLYREIFEFSETIKEISKELPSISPDEKLEKKIKKLSAISSKKQYSTFERLFRKESDVFNSLKKYVEYFKNCKLVVDLGAGRGEFVELLEKNGISAIGVEIDDSMIKEAEKRGIKLLKSDIIEFLKTRVDNSIDGIFSSQVIEHLEFEYLEEMLELAYKKLSPGGIIVLETVNPLSWFSFSHIYLLDPTHKLPVHPMMLEFLLKSIGFVNVKLSFSELPDKRLKELPKGSENYAIFNENFDLLNDLIFSETIYSIAGEKR